MRLFFGLLAGKITRFLLRLIGHNATQTPGVVAMKICPDILARLPKPKRIIAVTGTNGKTTVTNMLAQALTAAGNKVVTNHRGANIQTGVISTLLANATFSGHSKADIGVIEVDERSCRLILPKLKPQLMVVTNLFRDSVRRNAHPEYIRDFITSAVPQELKLILNADDPSSNTIAPNNPRVYFSFDKQDFEMDEPENIVNDARLCPKCHQPLVYDMRRYHQIGQYHCPNCGYQSPKAEYRLTKVDLKAKQATIICHGTSAVFPLCDLAIYNIYNTLAAVSMLSEFGLTPSQIATALADVKVVGSRLKHETVAGKPLTAIMAKGFNPVAVSRCVNQSATAKGKKIIVINEDDVFFAQQSSENVSWIYDVDYERLNNPDVVRIILYGPRHDDVKLRLLLAGIDESLLVEAETPEQVVSAIDPSICDQIFYLYDLYREPKVGELIKQIKQRYDTPEVQA